MSKFLLLIAIISVAFPPVLRAEEVVLTLDEAVAIALRDNREVLLKAQELRKAKAKIAEAQAGLFLR